MTTKEAAPARKRTWLAPDYRRISAGSAEGGAGTFGDGGGPGANRS